MPPIPPSATVTLARASVALLTGSLLVSAYMTVALRSSVDPVANVVSDYVFYRPGGSLFVLAVLLLVLSGAALLAGMTGLGIPRPRSVLAFFGLWQAGLLLCAVFPTNRTAGSSTLPGEIHRLAGATFLTSLPIAGWKLATALRSDPHWGVVAGRIRRYAGLGMLTAAVFGVCQLRLIAPGLPGTSLLPNSAIQGLLERFALGAEVALLLALAVSVARAAR